MGQMGCWTRLLLLMGVEEGKDATGLSDLTLGGLSMKFHLGGKSSLVTHPGAQKGDLGCSYPLIDQHYTWTFAALRFVKVVLLPLHWRLC